MRVTTYQVNSAGVDLAKESWLETLESMPSAPSPESYAWLYKTFRATVTANPVASAVHFNYARYQWTRLPQPKKSGLLEVIEWVESQVSEQGFDWSNLLMHFSILAHA